MLTRAALSRVDPPRAWNGSRTQVLQFVSRWAWAGVDCCFERALAFPFDAELGWGGGMDFCFFFYLASPLRFFKPDPGTV